MSWGGSDSISDSGSLFRNERFEFSCFTSPIRRHISFQFPSILKIKCIQFVKHSIISIKQKTVQSIFDKNDFFVSILNQKRLLNEY